MLNKIAMLGTVITTFLAILAFVGFNTLNDFFLSTSHSNSYSKSSTKKNTVNLEVGVRSYINKNLFLLLSRNNSFNTLNISIFHNNSFYKSINIKNRLNITIFLDDKKITIHIIDSDPDRSRATLNYHLE